MEENNCVDLTCVSFRATTATFENFLKVVVGMEGDIITYSADHNNTNGVIWAYAADRVTDISSMKAE